MTNVVAPSGEAADAQAPIRPAVLLVDDTPANLLALSAVLGSLPVRLVEARSGREALERIEEEPFAVVLLDAQMPEMDGFEVAERIRASDLGREVPIIFLTAIHRDEVYARRGYAHGAADYMTKPFDADILRARVKAFVDLFRQREEVRRAEVALRTEERDDAVRRLVAFERIATAALEHADLDELLRELLDIFVGATASVQFAAVLIREGEELRVRAVAGSTPSAALADARESIGDGFAGGIAASRQPRELGELAGSPIVPGPWVCPASARAMFGLPLTNDGAVVGVAYVTSTVSGAFADRDKRLFQAVAERASWAIAKSQQRARLQHVLDAAPALIAIAHGADHACDFSNPAFDAFFDAEKTSGVRLARLGLTGAALAVLDHVHRTGETVTSRELPLVVDWRGEKARETRYLDVTAQVLHGALGRAGSLLMFATDVTAQVRARHEVDQHQEERARLLENERAARGEAEIANRAKDEFLATVSHELRTPLNAILGWASIARVKAPPELEKALAIIERNARSQARIIEDVLDVSRIISGKLRLEPRPISVAHAVASAIEVVRPSADGKHIALDSEIDDSLVLAGDPDRIQQVLWNLLSNAIKFTPKGGRVAIEGLRREEQVVIRVRDTGQGIEPEFLPHVFDPFRQADASTTRRHGGLGIGLAIVKQLVAAHGGEVRALSDGAGHGATFEVELPAGRLTPAAGELRGGWALAATSATDPGPNEGRSNGHAVRLDRLRVLVIDDEEDARGLLVEALGERGADVTAASSMAEALQLLEPIRPDVIVSDIAMPGGDGYSLIRKMRKLPPERGGRTPAIALTAHARSEDVERAFAAGFQRHMEKPVDLERLASVVANLGGLSFGEG